MAEKEFNTLSRLPHPERIMLDILTDEDGQSLNGEIIMLIRNEFKRRGLELPNPLPEPKNRREPPPPKKSRKLLE